MPENNQQHVCLMKWSSYTNKQNTQYDTKPTTSMYHTYLLVSYNHQVSNGRTSLCPETVFLWNNPIIKKIQRDLI